jgi:hypothetical protein
VQLLSGPYTDFYRWAEEQLGYSRDAVDNRLNPNRAESFKRNNEVRNENYRARTATKVANDAGQPPDDRPRYLVDGASIFITNCSPAAIT